MRICDLDAEGKSLTWRAGDLRARKLLIDVGEAVYNSGEKRGACTLIHAQEYLKDRLAYELYPWPKNCVPINFGVEADSAPTDDPQADGR
jgi:hypothetical protein